MKCLCFSSWWTLSLKGIKILEDSWSSVKRTKILLCCPGSTIQCRINLIVGYFVCVYSHCWWYLSLHYWTLFFNMTEICVTVFSGSFDRLSAYEIPNLLLSSNAFKYSTQRHNGSISWLWCSSACGFWEGKFYINEQWNSGVIYSEIIKNYHCVEKQLGPKQ